MDKVELWPNQVEIDRVFPHLLEDSVRADAWIIYGFRFNHFKLVGLTIETNPQGHNR